MIPYLIAGCVGALLVNNTKPKTRVNKLKCIGPRTGTLYLVEELPQAGLLIVHYAGATGTFERRGTTGLHIIRGLGHPAALKLMKKDFESEHANDVT
jgi:hypothetical protein